MAEVVGSSCYAPVELDQGPAVPGEFDPETLLAWSDRLAGLGACQAVVALILKLDALSRVRMSGSERALLLHVLEGPTQRVLRARPRLTREAIQAMVRRGWGLTMEQRLACVGYRNLRQVLRDLDDAPEAPAEDVIETKQWVLEQQFRVLERQIGSAARIRLPPPPGTWLELHGRYRYVLDWEADRRNAEAGTGLDSETDFRSLYVRLLLLGIAAGAPGAELESEGFVARLRAWGGETGLAPAGASRPQSAVWVVDPALDGPPVEPTGDPGTGPGCLLLVPPPGFLALMEASAAPRGEARVRPGST